LKEMDSKPQLRVCLAALKMSWVLEHAYLKMH